MILSHLSKYNPKKITIFNTPKITKLIKIKEKYTLKHPYSKALILVSNTIYNKT